MKKMSIRGLLSIQLLTLSSGMYAIVMEKPTKNHITLESPALHTFDGTSVGMNGNAVRLIMYVRREINMQLFGKHNPNGTYAGTYCFENKNYTIQELVDLEHQLSINGTAAQRSALLQVLQIAKHDFIDKVHPFMENARNSKRVMLLLIEESCTKRKIEDTTLLIKWAESKTEEEEIAVFNQEINTFARFNKFCCDLLNFLGDLVVSCPKGVAQFKQSYDKQDKVLNLIPQLAGMAHVSTTKRDKFQHDFVHYLFENHLHKMTLAEITAPKLELLLEEFQNNS